MMIIFTYSGIIAFVVLKQGVQTIEEAAIKKYLIQCPQTVVGSKVTDISVTVEVSKFWYFRYGYK